MVRRRRTDTELREASGHLLYGFAQIVGTAERLANRAAADQITHNALIESFVSHVRASLEFFNSQPRFENDVVAGDFFDDPQTWRNAKPPWPAELDGVKDRADKELAHLTYSRNGKTDADKRWSFIAIAKAFEPIVQTFSRLVSPARLSETWNSIADEAKKPT